MALKKKNVFQGFMQDDYMPSDDQQIVKYVMGKGNNLHEVESPAGSTFLVTMPKKYRQTVWLKRGDCIVIDPIAEGKKVLGEIICVIPTKSVVDLIHSGTWPTSTSNNLGSGDNLTDIERRAALLAFFNLGNKNQDRSSTDADSMDLPPSNSSSEAEADDSDDDGDQDDENEDADADEEDCSEKSTENDTNSNKITIPENGKSQEIQGSSDFHIPKENGENADTEGFKSRVQFVASGIVTVTNVVNDITSLENGLQSLDFETEDSSEECNVSSLAKEKRDFHRKANTIRIQVNYPPESNTQPQPTNSS